MNDKFDLRHPGYVVLEVHLVGGPGIYTRIGHQRLEFVLCAFWRAGSAWAMMERKMRQLCGIYEGGGTLRELTQFRLR